MIKEFLEKYFPCKYCGKICLDQTPTIPYMPNYNAFPKWVEKFCSESCRTLRKRERYQIEDYCYGLTDERTMPKANFITAAVYRFLKWRKARRFVVRCDKCGNKFNARDESGLCPHGEIENFIYGWDLGSADGDYSAKVKMSKGKDGVLRIESTETIKNGEQFSDEKEAD